MTAEAHALGKLTLVDSQALTRARMKLKKILTLGGVNKFEIARTVGAVSELVRTSLHVAKEATIELDVSLSPDGYACVVDVSVWHLEEPADPSLSRYFEVTQERHRLQFRRSIPVGEPDENLQDQISEIMAERSEEEVKQLLVEKEAAEAAKLVQLQFIRKISHELRTPLNVIRGYGEMLMEDTTEPQTRDDLTHILKAGGLLLNIIDNVLDFSKSEMGDVEFVKESVSGRSFFDEIVHELTPLLESGGNNFTVACSDHLPTLTTDKGKLHYILSHLLTNASKFTESGRITFRAFEEKDNEVDGIRFVVEDTGQGIAKGELEQLFQPFVQSEPVGSGDGGLGIGLALCRRYSKVLGGKLDVESAPGEGTVFALWIPVALTD